MALALPQRVRQRLRRTALPRPRQLAPARRVLQRRRARLRFPTGGDDALRATSALAWAPAQVLRARLPCGDDVAWPRAQAAPFRRARASRAPNGRGYGKSGRRSAATSGCEPERPSGAVARSPRQPRCRTHPPCHALEACSTHPPTAKRASRRPPGLPRLRRHGYRAPAPDLRYRQQQSCHDPLRRPTRPHSATRSLRCAGP